jgi:type I restriction-modification system DNA methylase subunit
MSDALEAVIRLTQPSLPSTERRIALLSFAQVNGWRPSYEINDYPGTEGFANGHLVVEHGLDNSAVLTFLKSGTPFSQLVLADQKRLLTISYNNLVDWHFFPDRTGLTCVYNRSDPVRPTFISIQENPDSWRAEAFDRVVGRRPSPNLKSLDDALIETLSLWKRLLAAEMGNKASNEEISALFNSLLLVRALEDHRRWQNQAATAERALIGAWHEIAPSRSSLLECVKLALQKLGISRWPKEILDAERLKCFDSLEFETVLNLLGDFYNNRFAPYEYDFSLMSKHALSRVYERYVSLLRSKDSPQMTLFPDLPDEISNRATGAYYTPQYIARFFARFLRENFTPPVFRNLKLMDPACGSAIFLRSILEMQCDPWQDIDIQSTTEQCFKNAWGVDIDNNACEASRLSLSLLYLILTGSFPRRLNIVNSEAVDYLSKPSQANAYDVIVANPPFIPWDRLSAPMKERVSRFMQEDSAGKVDMFLAILKLAIGLVKPGGFLLYVLPHPFLLAKNAEKLRKEISEKFWIRCIADLSSVSVFGAVGSYVILLVAQKKGPNLPPLENATIVDCKDFVGHALEDALDGKRVKNDFYHVYEVGQDSFAHNTWSFLPPDQTRLQAKFHSFRCLEDFLCIRQGLVTGADNIFIIEQAKVPKGEEGVYLPFLSDREMTSYTVPSKTPKAVFYPFAQGAKLTAAQIRDRFPKTWAYLNSHAKELKERKAVKTGYGEWWALMWPRSPHEVLRPKIVTPHLVITPRFSLDAFGKYAVTRGPFMYPIESGNDIELLRYFLAVLNSPCVHWQMVASSHKYSRGYLMLELKTLKKLRVPDPSQVPAGRMKRIQELVSERMKPHPGSGIQKELDELVLDLYGLSERDRKTLGAES